MYRENATEEKPALTDTIILPKKIFNQCKKVTESLKIESKTVLMEIMINWLKR
jgi:hypothetical protein